MHFQSTQDRKRCNNGEAIYSQSNKKTMSNSTLGRSGRKRHRMGGMTSSSSATSCNSCSDNILVPNGDISYHHEQSQQQRMCSIDNGIIFL
nr:unnamed protein product [Callosobruchus analis]